MTYAAKTQVPMERSRAELERLVAKYGATRFVSGWDEDGARVGFTAHNRMVRFVLPLPKPPQKSGAYGHDAKVARWEQECRSRWRALVLAVKAKLEVVESGISTFEDEFLAHIVMPGGETVGESVRERIAAAYAGGPTMPLLGDGR